MKTNTTQKTRSKKEQTRLLKPEQFSKVFSEPSVRLSNKFILLLARETSLPYARLGLVVAKKKIPLAVNRNRFKRIAREFFRANQKPLKSLDVVILARNDLTILPRNEQNQAFDTLFSKLKNKNHAKE